MGIADAMKVAFPGEVITRTEASETQTRKSRFARWKNVEDVFTVTQPEKLESKHILLVDDVITTGSTLEACARRILDVLGAKVSVATIATTMAH